MESNKNDDNAESSQDYYYAAKESLDVLTITSNNNAPSPGIEPQGTEGTDMQDDSNSQSPQSWKDKLLHLYEKEGLLIEVMLAILFARLYPKLGAEYLFPEISAHIIAVIVIFCKFNYSWNQPRRRNCFWVQNMLESLGRQKNSMLDARIPHTDSHLTR
jgi:hypothetical protein